MTDKEKELIYMLMEECAEIIQACSKILRFGKDDCCPRTDLTSTEQLNIELADVVGVINLLSENNVVKIPSENFVKLSIERKLYFSKHQGETDTYEQL